MRSSGRFSRQAWKTVLRHPGLMVEVLRLKPRLARELGVPVSQLERWYRDLFYTDQLPARLHARWREYTGRVLGAYASGASVGPANEVLYLIVRALAPETVVETGVSFGFSTAYLLQGLHDNRKGGLYSIDLPNLDPRGYTNADGIIDQSFVRAEADVGGAVPPELRDRWSLASGRSQELLPSLLARLGQVDVFLHDSEHSFENMLWEYRAAWPRLRPGGYLLSDDVLQNRAFETFCAEQHGRPFLWLGRGALRKGPLTGLGR